MQLPAFALLPEDLKELRAPNSADHLFSVLQRATRWPGSTPADLLGREGRSFLASSLDVTLPEIASKVHAHDGSTKVTLKLADGALIEAIHMPREVRNPRVTMCISSQVGC